MPDALELLGLRERLSIAPELELPVLTELDDQLDDDDIDERDTDELLLEPWLEMELELELEPEVAESLAGAEEDELLTDDVKDDRVELELLLRPPELELPEGTALDGDDDEAGASAGRLVPAVFTSRSCSLKLGSLRSRFAPLAPRPSTPPELELPLDTELDADDEDDDDEDEVDDSGACPSSRWAAEPSPASSLPRVDRDFGAGEDVFRDPPAISASFGACRSIKRI